MHTSSTKPLAKDDSRPGDHGARASSSRRPWRQLLLVIVTPIVLAAIADNVIARLIGYGIGSTYRRVGPTSGPQVFCAGSSVLQYSLAWPEISKRLGQGIEHTNVAGATPEMWETFQVKAAGVNTTIVGISAYDLNDYRTSRGFPYFVPLTQTIQYLRQSDATWEVTSRVLSEYPTAYLRMLFPTMGDSDVFLVGFRRLIRQRLHLAGAVEDQARVLALPQDDLLDFGTDEERLSDLPRDRVLRRLALLRREIDGRHEFNGPKLVALRRIVERGRQQGRVIIVVLPQSRDYVREFLTPKVNQEFENVVVKVHSWAPESSIVRLDRVAAFESDDHFTDFVHMNSSGRAIATRLFMDQLDADAKAHAGSGTNQ